MSIMLGGTSRAPWNLLVGVGLTLGLSGCLGAGQGRDDTTSSGTSSSGTSSEASSSEDTSEATSTDGGGPDLGGDPRPVAILAFEVSEPEPIIGQSVTVAWTTLNAASCSFTGGSAQWPMDSPSLPEGERSITVDFEGPLAFGLTCVGEDPEDVVADELIITGLPEPIDCSTPELDLGMDLDWDDVFFAPFPDKLQANQDISIPGDQYFSVAFNTGDFEGNLSVSTIALQGGVRWVSISRCPAQFTTNTPPECLDAHGIGDVLQASTNPDSGGCVLEPDTDYFINVTYVDLVEPIAEPSSCPGFCTIRFTVGVG